MLSLITLKSIKSQKICYRCRKEFQSKSKNLSKIKSHCHFTGKYRDLPHSDCNLRYAMPQQIPIVMHVVIIHIVMISM